MSTQTCTEHPTEDSLRRRHARCIRRIILKHLGGFTFTEPDGLPFDTDHAQTSTRSERRRKKLGRA
jgi:hypothetical protein